MAPQSSTSDRVFKSFWFSRAAKKANIAAAELCSAIRQVMLGQADDLGGGAFKKRLNKNMYRSIIVARSGRFWVFEYLFAKHDQANIPHDKLLDLRRLAKSYNALTQLQVDELIEKKLWMEICHG